MYLRQTFSAFVYFIHTISKYLQCILEAIYYHYGSSANLDNLKRNDLYYYCLKITSISCGTLTCTLQNIICLSYLNGKFLAITSGDQRRDNDFCLT